MMDFFEDCDIKVLFRSFLINSNDVDFLFVVLFIVIGVGYEFGIECEIVNFYL